MSITAQLVGPYERLMLLKALSLSAHPPAAALAALAQQAEERHLVTGAPLRSTDMPWDSVHIVVEGRVSVSESDRELYSAGPMEAVGMLETLARVENGVEARAEIETVTLEIQAATLFSVLEDHYVMTL